MIDTALMTVVAAVVVAFGALLAAMGIYLALLSVAALFSRNPQPKPSLSTSLVVLIPAHNEAALIARCVRTLQAQSYASHLYATVVIADNCTDATAATAAQAGADRVMRRDEPNARGKGQALRWAIDRLFAEGCDADAIVVIDADTVADPRFLATLVVPFEAGAPAVQGESLLYGDGSRSSALRVAAFLLINRVRQAGRAALGLPATHLSGNGMLVGCKLLRARPWSAFSSAEDVEYSLSLQVDGIKIAFAGGAVLMSPTAPTARAASAQQLRWEGGKVHLARTWIPRLVRAALADRRPSLLDIAFDLAVPPLGFLAAGVVAGSLVAVCLLLVGILAPFALVPWVCAWAALTFHVIVGMKAGGASRYEYRALLGAPLFVVLKPFRARRVLAFSGDSWVRTERATNPEIGTET